MELLVLTLFSSCFRAYGSGRDWGGEHWAGHPLLLGSTEGGMERKVTDGAATVTRPVGLCLVLLV